MIHWNYCVSNKMNVIYSSDDLTIWNITVDNYTNIIASQSLVKLFDDGVELGGRYELPAVQYAIAAFYETKYECH